MPRTRKDEAPLLVNAPVIHGDRRIQPDEGVPADDGGGGREHGGHSGCPVTTDERTARVLADKFIMFLEAGDVPEGLFTADVFLDFTMPLWRLQAQGIEETVAVRKAGHPGPGRVPRSRLDTTTTGFVLEVEEQWDHQGESWYCRELFRADVSDGSVSQLSVYCTGDWDRELVARHAAEVHLIRP